MIVLVLRFRVKGLGCCVLSLPAHTMSTSCNGADMNNDADAQGDSEVIAMCTVRWQDLPDTRSVDIELANTGTRLKASPPGSSAVLFRCCSL
jgi:hypothetical protein